MSDFDDLPITWADAHFEGINVEYDEVRIRLTDYRGISAVVTCEGWISLTVAAFRDDSFVDSGRLFAEDPRIDASRIAVGARAGSSGSPSRDTARFALLELGLDDGAVVECVAASFRVTFPNAH